MRAKIAIAVEPQVRRRARHRLVVDWCPAPVGVDVAPAVGPRYGAPATLSPVGHGKTSLGSEWVVARLLSTLRRTRLRCVCDRCAASTSPSKGGSFHRQPAAG